MYHIFLILIITDLWWREGQWWAHLGAVADSRDLWDRNPHCLRWCCGSYSLHVCGFGVTKLHAIILFSLFNDLLNTFVCSGSSSCAICLLTLPALFRLCFVPPTGGLDSSSITGKNSPLPNYATNKILYILISHATSSGFHKCDFAWKICNMRCMCAP